ncbi:MAG: type II secretion system F family protein [Gammaproteobacteria bacterium]|nr:type II secretion system F family protein [Gammaproteobacteria bacterium]
MFTFFFKTKTFYWTGRDQAGIFVRGTLKATRIPLAKALLERRNIEILSLRSQTLLSFFSKNKALSPKRKLAFMRQLATLVHAQIPIVQALGIIQQKLSGHDKRVELLATLQGDLERGFSLSEAFSKHPQYFDPLLCGLVRVGENSGTLEVILETIIAHQEKQLAGKQKVYKALFYPTLTLILSSVIGVAALLIVLPRFEALFMNVGAPLPLMTRSVLSLSRFLTRHIGEGIGLLLLFFFLLKNMKRFSEKWALWIDERILKCPLIGSWIAKNVLARFCCTLALMLKAGIPITEGIAWMKGLLHWRPYERALKFLHEELKEGKKLQDALRSENLFPPWMVQMIAIGEESGRLDFMLNTVSDSYEEQITSDIEKATESLEPLVILVVGAFVGILVVALYLPIFQLGHVIG